MKISNWNQFTQYKDRKPLWIKLQRDLLDDRTWHALSDRAAKTLVMLWLLASETEGEVVGGIETISFRLRMGKEDVQIAINELCDRGFLVESDETSLRTDPYASVQECTESYSDPQVSVQASTGSVHVHTEGQNLCIPEEKRREEKNTVSTLQLVGVEQLEDRFAEFWSAYPRKVTKAEAQKLWSKLNLDRHADVILTSLEKHKAQDQWQKDDGKFVPHARTWLSQRRWEDEVEAGEERNNCYDVLPPWMKVAG